MVQLQAVVPRSVLVLYPIVLIFLMAGSRFAYRVWKEHRLYSPLEALGEPVLVIGAGEAGARLAQDLTRSRQWRVVGLLDDDPAKQGRRARRRCACSGPIARAAALVREVRRAQGDHRAAVGQSRRAPARGRAVRDAGVEALTVPSYEDLISGRLALTTIRNVELDDLLGRDPVVLDSAGLGDWLGNRVVMVTGAGGSIGAELDAPDRALPSRAPRAVRHLRGGALRDPHRARRCLPAACRSSAVVGDVKHAALVDDVLAREKPERHLPRGAPTSTCR